MPSKIPFCRAVTAEHWNLTAQFFFLFRTLATKRNRRNAKLMIVLLSIVDFGLAAMMAALGITSLIEMNFGALNDLTEAFLAVYMVIFAVLLALYEFIWWSPIAALNKTFRKNFGFMYGLKGKGFYLIFIAFLCLGLWKDDQTAVEGLDWATGIAWLATGFAHIFMSMCWPEVNEMYKPATAGLTNSQENVV